MTHEQLNQMIAIEVFTTLDESEAERAIRRAEMLTDPMLTPRLRELLLQLWRTVDVINQRS